MPLAMIFLCFFMAAGLTQAAQPAPSAGGGPIEVYVNGARYDSVEDYKALRKSPQDDVAKVKARTIVLAPDVSRALDKISVEPAIGRVMADFKQNWDDPAPKFTISTAELEDRIRALVADRKEPVLLISQPQKLTVAAYGGQEGDK